MKIRIPHNRPTFGKEEKLACRRVMKSGWVGQGKEVEMFENELCEYIGLPKGHAVMVSSGTAALFLAIKHIGLKIVHYPTYSCSSVRYAIKMAGCRCLPLEVTDPYQDVYCHLFGMVNDVMTYPLKRDMPIIEDCAQAIGARMKGKMVGTFGDYGIFSFSATKMITSGGQGGAIVSKDWNRIEEIRDYRNFDMRKDEKSRFNFTITDLQAAIGRAQLSKLNNFIERREEIFQKYVRAGFGMVQNIGRDLEDVRYRAVLKTGKQREIIKGLEDRGIRAIVPIEDFEIPNVHRFPLAQRMTKDFISLPCYPTLTDKEVDLIISEVRKWIY